MELLAFAFGWFLAACVWYVVTEYIERRRARRWLKSYSDGLRAADILWKQKAASSYEAFCAERRYRESTVQQSEREI